MNGSLNPGFKCWSVLIYDTKVLVGINYIYIYIQSNVISVLGQGRTGILPVLGGMDRYIEHINIEYMITNLLIKGILTKSFNDHITRRDMVPLFDFVILNIIELLFTMMFSLFYTFILKKQQIPRD